MIIVGKMILGCYWPARTPRYSLFFFFPAGLIGFIGRINLKKEYQKTVFRNFHLEGNTLPMYVVIRRNAIEKDKWMLFDQIKKDCVKKSEKILSGSKVHESKQINKNKQAYQ